MLAAQEEAVREDQALWSFSARCGWVSLKGFPVACGRRPSLGLPCLTEGACYSWALQAPRRALFWGCVSCPGLGWAGLGGVPRVWEHSGRVAAPRWLERPQFPSHWKGDALSSEKSPASIGGHRSPPSLPISVRS